MEKPFKLWLKWIRDEQKIMQTFTGTYMPDVTEDYRRGRIDGLRAAESHLGLLMIGHGGEEEKPNEPDRHDSSEMAQIQYQLDLLHKHCEWTRQMIEALWVAASRP